MADIHVGPARDARRFLDTDELVWFAEPSRQSPGQELSGIREDQRFAAEVADGDWSGLSVLHASEPAIYGRHGYGVASLETRVTLSRGAALTAPGLEPVASALGTRRVAAGALGCRGPHDHLTDA